MTKRLGKLLEDLDTLYTEPFTPASFNTAVPLQLDLFGVWHDGRNAKQLGIFNPPQPDFTKTGDHITLGNFYEMMSQGLFGGRRLNQLFVNSPNGQNGNLQRELVKLVKPDIVDREHNRMLEVKAFVTGRQCNISDTQMHGYSAILAAIPDTAIYFAFYRHTVPNVRPTHYKGTDEDLCGELAQSTMYAIVLPFSAVRVLHDSPSRQPDFAYRDVNSSGPSTYIRSQVTGHFLEDPEGTLSRLGLSPDDYEIKRFRSPPAFYVGSSMVKQFPILVIHDRGRS